ncbi:DUF3231 family protein [Paenibacillus sp. BSR1-1]|uniref:DUF3231 family protein n=1 Tax=Paenibacillus sp. BSR1-1 TaxID=3020845 RepID=UPI0025B1E881|nr:DUF3231 family protein [Paenibacillus sp. BSR1-1]MDN3015317.1 DUF3231 family protein [Paenibacillus sp. BSR1-1]
MTNIFESIKDLFAPLVDGEEKKPLHTGEVTNLWVLLTLLEEGLIVYQLGLNTTKDDQLVHAFTNGEQLSRSLIDRLRNFFIKEGIPLPPASEAKPKSNQDTIPLGVKYTDEELANLVSAKIAAEITLIGQALAMGIRNDVCQKFFEIQYEIFKYGCSFKLMMQNRGWLKIPPYYYPPGLPRN